jgi:hypothetical protein
VTQPQLRAVVEAKLALRWSPEQIAGWLPLAYPSDPVLRVSQETIYLSLLVQSRGALRREEMAEHLRFTVHSGVQVDFCDQRSPGSAAPTRTPTGCSANTSPSAPTSVSSTRPHWMPSRPLNGRPRQTLGFKTPSQVLAEALP